MTPETVRRLIDDLEAEINNGGFDQYFYNAAGGEAREAIEALQLIDATVTVSIVRRACERFPGGMPPIDRRERQTLLRGQVAPDDDDDAFEADDAAFLAYEEDLAGLVAAYQARFRSGPLSRWLPRLRRR